MIVAARRDDAASRDDPLDEERVIAWRLQMSEFLPLLHRRRRSGTGLMTADELARANNLLVDKRPY
jgi:hypothetical protein